MGLSLVDLYTSKYTEIQADKVGATISDDTPYSLGLDKNGSKNIDEPAITKLEAKHGERYALGNLGEGSQYSPGYTSVKKYSDSVNK